VLLEGDKLKTRLAPYHMFDKIPERTQSNHRQERGDQESTESASSSEFL
jgi:hypothetical protein